MTTPQRNSPSLWVEHFPRLQEDGHKYSRGYLLIIAGQLPGAIKLASYAARRMGVGLVKVICPESEKVFYGDLAPGTIIETYKSVLDIKQQIDNEDITAYLYGPGVTNLDAEAQEVVFYLLSQNKPTLLDAGALTCFENNKESLYENLHKDVVVTPHEGEYRRVFGWWKDREESVRKLGETVPAVCVLKGPKTLIMQDGDITVEEEAPATLATAGTGDVLSGFVGSLLAQRMPPVQAAQAAVYLHGACANHFAEAKGGGMIAEDIADQLSGVLTKVIK